MQFAQAIEEVDQIDWSEKLPTNVRFARIKVLINLRLRLMSSYLLRMDDVVNLF